MRAKPAVLVGGMVGATAHQGGATWAVLQWVLGLIDLGHDVLLVDEARTFADWDRSVAYSSAVFASAGLHERWALLEASSGRTAGRTIEDLERHAQCSEVLINLSGTIRAPRLLERTPTRVFVDLDPFFVQTWQEQGIDMNFDAHTHFATVGLNMGANNCHTPDCGLDWFTTLPPVFLPKWPKESRPPSRGFTTVANWRSYGAISGGQRLFGQKAHSFRELIELPKLADVPMTIALDIHPNDFSDLVLLGQNGWITVPPSEVAGTPEFYQSFVQSSMGEIGVAKSGYVLARSGWFSERSAAYLASGRPVVAQDTGASVRVPERPGLRYFDTADGAAEAIRAILRDYERSATDARALAEERLCSRRVIGALLDRVT